MSLLVFKARIVLAFYRTVYGVLLEVDVTIERMEKYLGQPVKDPYGRVLGTVISFYSDSDGYVTSVEICLGETKFMQVPIDRVKLNNDALVLLPEWQYEAEKVAKRLERLRKRVHAIEDLYAKKEIPRHAYEVFKKKLDEELAKVKEKAEKVKEDLKKKLHELEDTIIQLERAFTAVKISYIAGEIGDKAYKQAADHLRRYLEYTMAERDDVKRYIERIEKLETQPPPLHRAPEKVEGEVPGGEQPLPVVVIEGS